MNTYETELNVTPLIDVLLVLFVMLIITIPIATHAVKLDLPSGRPAPDRARAVVDIDIDVDGSVFWNGAAASMDKQLEQWFVLASRSTPQPIIRIWPERRARYERVVQVLAAAQRARITSLALAPVPQ